MVEQAVTACWRRLEIDSNGSAHESGVKKTPVGGRSQVITRSVQSIWETTVHIIDRMFNIETYT